MLVSRIVAGLFVLLVAGFVGLSTMLRDPADTATRLPADLDVSNVELTRESFLPLAAAFYAAPSEEEENSGLKGPTIVGDLAAAEGEVEAEITDLILSLINEHMPLRLDAEALEAAVSQTVTEGLSEKDMEAFADALIEGVPTQEAEETAEIPLDEDTPRVSVLVLSEQERRELNFASLLGERTIALMLETQGEKGAINEALEAAELPALKAALRPRLTSLSRVAFREYPIEAFEPMETASGSTNVNRRADIRARTSSTVAEIRVTRGDQVEAGQVLLVLERDDRDARRLQAVAGIAQAEASELQSRANLTSAEAAIASATAQIEQAETSLADARDELADTTALVERGARTQNQLRAAQSRVDQAEQSVSVAQAGLAQSQASLAQAEAGLAQAGASKESAIASLAQVDLDIERLTITAPFAGRIEEQFVELGGAVNAGEHVFRLGDMSTMVISTNVPDAVRQTLALGQSVTVTVGSGANAVNVEGPITLIDSSAVANTRTFEVQIEIPNILNAAGQPLIVGNQFATITFRGSPVDLYRIPRSALTSAVSAENAEGDTGIKTLSAENIVEFTPVSLSDYTDGGELLITADRIPGDGPMRLITAGGGFVKIGDLVDARQELDEMADEDHSSDGAEG